MGCVVNKLFKLIKFTSTEVDKNQRSSCPKYKLFNRFYKILDIIKINSTDGNYCEEFEEFYRRRLQSLLISGFDFLCSLFIESTTILESLDNWEASLEESDNFKYQEVEEFYKNCVEEIVEVQLVGKEFLSEDTVLKSEIGKSCKLLLDNKISEGNFVE